MSLFIGTEAKPLDAQRPFPHPDYESHEFGFGLEAEFLLVHAPTYTPLWHNELSFKDLNAILESIPFADIDGNFSRLEVEAPHRQRMPFVVEGYHIPDESFRMVDIKPKGVEIRTPVCSSIASCLKAYRLLYERLQAALAPASMQLACLSHHPTAADFYGPPNKRRYDYWQWAMEVMTTYGPDINISLPSPLLRSFAQRDFEMKINYYGPALTALSVGSPFLKGDLWQVNGKVGKSYRTHRRSIIAPPLELHAEEGNRFEFKVFEMTPYLSDFHGFFLLFLVLLLDESLAGRSDKATRIYELGEVAKLGLEAAGINEKLQAIFSRAYQVLKNFGFDPSHLNFIEERWQTGRVYADELLAIYQQRQSLADVLKFSSSLKH